MYSRALFNFMAIALQGLANRVSAHPRLYLTYPPGWAFSYTTQVREYLASPAHNVSFNNLTDPADTFGALAAGAGVASVVVWDPAVRESLLVAFTVAGLEDALVVTDALLRRLPAAARALPVAANFSGAFDGWAPAAIYRHAKDKYFSGCSKNYLITIGGAATGPGGAPRAPSRGGSSSAISSSSGGATAGGASGGGRGGSSGSGGSAPCLASSSRPTRPSEAFLLLESNLSVCSTSR